ncbi:MAG: MBL fold metallo-hydrolase [Verrucomicrobiota bacterium]
MLHLTILGSGSQGNSAYVTDGDTSLLIDAGLSCKQLCLRLESIGVDPASLDGILLTHEHGDHVRGLKVLLRRCEVPLYCNLLTREAMNGTAPESAKWKIFESGNEFEIGGMQIETFRVAHDAAEPVGFVLKDAESSLGILSDVGWITNLVRSRLEGVQTLFVEANYDETMLQNDTVRPWSTKQRISSRHGHLSNTQTAELAAHLAPEGLQQVVLGHLSGDCNAPEVAAEAIRNAPGCRTIPVLCACQDTPTTEIRVSLRENPLPTATETNFLHSKQLEFF